MEKVTTPPKQGKLPPRRHKPEAQFSLAPGRARCQKSAWNRLPVNPLSARLPTGIDSDQRRYGGTGNELGDPARHAARASAGSVAGPRHGQWKEEESDREGPPGCKTGKSARVGERLRQCLRRAWLEPLPTKARLQFFTARRRQRARTRRRRVFWACGRRDKLCGRQGWRRAWPRP